MIWYNCNEDLLRCIIGPSRYTRDFFRNIAHNSGEANPLCLLIYVSLQDLFFVI